MSEISVDESAFRADDGGGASVAAASSVRQQQQHEFAAAAAPLKGTWWQLKAGDWTFVVKEMFVQYSELLREVQDSLSHEEKIASMNQRLKSCTTTQTNAIRRAFWDALMAKQEAAAEEEMMMMV